MGSKNVAIVGATGAVGESMLELLESRKFPVDNLYLLASERSAGSRLPFAERNIRVENLADFDFGQVDIGLFSAGSSVSAEFAPKAAAAGCVVIDNTSYFRRDPEIPLIIPEVNLHRLPDYVNKNIIANPNCSTIQMLVALKPIYDAVGISRIHVSTYQAVSGAGKAGVEELAGQTARLLNVQSIENRVFPAQIAFNAIPAIGEFEENGFTSEEMKMIWETHKIFEDDSIQVSPTCVRIPVFYGHSEAVYIETRKPVSAVAARQLFSDFPGIEVVDDVKAEVYPTAVAQAAGSDPVYVGRIRKDVANELGLHCWVVSDNVRKGAALNSVQIAEHLIEQLL
ncbi:MAG: aspartate-semialdehyde dehydrogenase [Pseudomonadales bacterium]|jgi:aspartate-semialdehyde dehydrogenase|nr:aspartate-semialdehyde dehydrogenase [Pseudomonadales bacterium]